MTDAEKDEVVALAFEYMRAHKEKDRNKEWISRKRILLFMTLERLETASEPRRAFEEGVAAGAEHDSPASDSVGG